MIINKSISLILFSFISYLILGTGIQGDDITEIVKMSSMTYEEYLKLSPELHGHYVFGVPAHYSLFWAYKVFGLSDPLAFEILKIVFHYICLYMIFKFFCQYLNKETAVLAGLIFILIPIHDATTYWFMALVYIVPPSLLMYSDYLWNLKRKKIAFISNFVGATFFYTSVPFSLAFSLLNIFKRNYKKSLFFLIPSIAYIGYYISMSILYSGIERKISYELTILGILKNLLGQFITLIDSNIGISFALKILLSIGYIDILGLMASVILISLIWVNRNKLLFEKKSFIRNFHDITILGILLIIVSSLIFVISNRYFQSPFNLGNRTLIYSSLIVSILFVNIFSRNKQILLIGYSLLIFATIGNSNHWKEAWVMQSKVINNIRSNKDLEAIPRGSSVIVIGNGYIKQGIIDNIEFLIMPWNLRSLFSNKDHVSPVFATSELNINGNQITNLKFNETVYINSQIYLYNTQSNTLTKSNVIEIKELIKSLEPHQRHWIQILDNDQLKLVTQIISPRLSYLFKNG